VNSETMLMPVLDGEALMEVEATFLCGEASLVGCRGEDLPLSVPEIRPLGTHQRAAIDYQPVMPTVRTSSRRCC
jgi:hypothetical protein